MILKQVFFVTGKDTILKVSYPVLDAVVMALKAFPDIKRVRVEGHTDNQGKGRLQHQLVGSPRQERNGLPYRPRASRPVDWIRRALARASRLPTTRPSRVGRSTAASIS